MGKNDDGLEWYLNRETIFADFCNGVLYDGKKVVLPQDLAERQHKRDGGLLPDYQLHVVHLAKLDENKFETGLRELIGMMKRRDSREEMQAYCKEHAERFANMDDSTYDIICTMLQVKSLEARKESCRMREGGKINMCKAFDDWAKDERKKGKKEGRKEGEKEGTKKGIEIGEKRFGALVERLMEEGRIGDVKEAAGSLEVRQKFYREFGI